jgi:antitoxin CptB
VTAELNKLRWRCRRGMRELDMVFDRFLVEDHPALDEEGRTRFLALLEVTDPELYDWLLGRVAPPAHFAELIQDLQRHHPHP